MYVYALYLDIVCIHLDIVCTLSALATSFTRFAETCLVAFSFALSMWSIYSAVYLHCAGNTTLTSSQCDKLEPLECLSLDLLAIFNQSVFNQSCCSHIQMVNTHTLREDRELKDFLMNLVSMFLDRESSYSRIDLLQCPVAQSIEGENLLRQMKELLKVPVFASSDILGACISESGKEGAG